MLPNELHCTPFSVKSPTRWTRFLGVAIGLLLLLGSSSCASLSDALDAALPGPSLELSILQVEPNNQPGTYTVTGKAGLPNQTRITVSAIRYLQPDVPGLVAAASSPTYSILDRQIATVGDGNWRTTVKLWQVAPDGKLQEAWQLNQAGTGTKFEPALSVMFVATLDPGNQPKNLRRRAERLDETTQAALMRFTPDGELYLQASKTLMVGLPTETTAPPAPEPLAPRKSPRPASQPAPAKAEPDMSWRQIDSPIPPDRIFR